jgi:hypothetical protein
LSNQWSGFGLSGSSGRSEVSENEIGLEFWALLIETLGAILARSRISHCGEPIPRFSSDEDLQSESRSGEDGSFDAEDEAESESDSLSGGLG